VVVTRPTEYEQLIAEQGTREQASFYLRTRGRDIAEAEERHRYQVAARDRVVRDIPREWRRAMATRADLDRFLFEADDVIVVVGQDGLVPNVAKYLAGQPVVGVNPDPSAYEGVLVRCAADEVAELARLAAEGRAPVEERVMVEAVADDGARLIALNEVFVGHHSHQSARYRLAVRSQELRQISSGLIVSTGTGATGWARSISVERHSPTALPKPDEPALAYFVREPFPASGSEISLTEGLLDSAASLTVWSEMETGGVVFGDGIESDAIAFGWGRRVEVRVAAERLRLVRP
jgi:hypothetical protein